MRASTSLPRTTASRCAIWCPTSSKHNEANLEDNRDGSDNNLSWNCGVEGPTDDPAILALRERQSRNFIATLLLSQGVPMLLAGDEIARTQQGNNNAYCQDSPLSWVDWSLDESRSRLLEFVRRMIALRRAHPVFHRRHFFQGRPLHGGGGKDLAWLKPDGTEMAEQEWEHDFARCLGVYLGGDALDEIDARGRPIFDDSFIVLFNAHHDPIPFTLPPMGAGSWLLLMDTARDDGLLADGVYQPHGSVRARRPQPRAVQERRSAVKRMHRMPFGAELDGPLTRFRLWAPAAERVELLATVDDDRREQRLRVATTAGSKRRSRPVPAPATPTGSTAASSFPIRRRASIPTTSTPRACVVDPQAYEWRDAELAGTAVGGGGRLRAARRNVHARRHVRRGRRGTSIICWISA